MVLIITTSGILKNASREYELERIHEYMHVCLVGVLELPRFFLVFPMEFIKNFIFAKLFKDEIVCSVFREHREAYLNCRPIFIELPSKSSLCKNKTV